jgi:biopolymer transport protein ExbB
MEVWYTVVKFFSNGGVFMYPIVFVLALGVAIAVERYITLTLVAKKNRETWARLEPIVRKGEFEEARDLANKDDSTIALLLSAGLARQGAVRRREDIDRAMEETLMAIIPRVEKRTHYLATFANMSTLAGLLGTIIGLIDAFTAVSNASVADKAELLSASISIGMNCTAFGLMVAIPLVLVHSLLQTKTTELIDSLEMVSVKIVNSIAERAHYMRPAIKTAEAA